ncbi:MAG: hypothetical protein ABSD29_15230 [Verrucomicrobiota bacterium]
MDASLLLSLEKTRQSQLGRCPDCGFKALPYHLAADFNSAIVISVADVLQQVRHLGKRAPLAITGQVLFPFAGVRLSIRLRMHEQKLLDTKTGYEQKMSVVSVPQRLYHKGLKV